MTGSGEAPKASPRHILPLKRASICDRDSGGESRAGGEADSADLANVSARHGGGDTGSCREEVSVGMEGTHHLRSVAKAMPGHGRLADQPYIKPVDLQLLFRPYVRIIPASFFVARF